MESGQNGICEDHNGDVWMTAALCVMKFNPEKLVQSQRQIIPPIRVSKLFYSKDNVNWIQQIIAPRHTPAGGGVSGASSSDGAGATLSFGAFNGLPSAYKYLRFEYVANSISAPKSLRFKYRLKGFTDEWSQPVYTKSAEFTNLNYGKYRFEVQCSLDGVRWSPVAASPEIRVLPPPWRRWYMWLLYTALLAMAVAGVTYVAVKRHQRKKMELLIRQKLENELQLRTLHSKVMPHFTKNVLTAIGNFAMEDHRKAGYYISLFSKYTQLTLENSDKNYNTLESELKYVETFLGLQKMRFDVGFDYNICVDKAVNMNTTVPTMALHTYCDNAIRHGLVNKKGSGALEVNIAEQENGVMISVTDNGIGRQRSSELGTQGNGIGLQLIQQQLDFYNMQNKSPMVQTIHDLKDENCNVTGTRAELFIPYGYDFTPLDKELIINELRLIVVIFGCTVRSAHCKLTPAN